MNMITGKNESFLSQRQMTIVSFSLFSAWLLSFPFEGELFYALTENNQIQNTPFNLLMVFANFLGLFFSGFIIKKQAAAKATMLISLVACITGSLIFVLPLSILWYIAMVAIAFFAGLIVASWAFFFKNYTETSQRLRTAADVLIWSNLLMIAINVVTVNLSVYLGLGLAISCLIGAIWIVIRIENNPVKEVASTNTSRSSFQKISILSPPFLLLCFFILVITINSGLMYQVVKPAFEQYQFLTSYYWALPYITALIVLKRVSARIIRAYALYIAMTMIGLAYLAFMWLDKSMISYLVVDTLMLGAFGVCDLFWWSILGHLLDYTDNPAKIFGIGLSMNVLGILIGGFIGETLFLGQDAYLKTSVMALTVLFGVMIMLPVLNSQLVKLLKTHTFLVGLGEPEKFEPIEQIPVPIYYKDLTEKEIEVVEYLLKGYTYRVISEQLFISENTVKYHIRNIYQKLQINSRMELINLFTANKNIDKNLRV